MSLVRELGPVLAATMLAGRVGSRLAAQLGTMRVTEQIDALDSLGANPIHYLVVPRFLACFFAIPSLTVMADFMGVVGGYFYSIFFLGHRQAPLLLQFTAVCRHVGFCQRRVQELFLRGDYRLDQLLPWLHLSSGCGGCRSGGDGGVRAFVCPDPGRRSCS